MPCFTHHAGIVVLVNANVNLESDIEAAYKTIIPAFKEFLGGQAGKVTVIHHCHLITIKIHML